jgi:hypothetical protein
VQKLLISHLALGPFAASILVLDCRSPLVLVCSGVSCSLIALACCLDGAPWSAPLGSAPFVWLRFHFAASACPGCFKTCLFCLSSGWRCAVCRNTRMPHHSRWLGGDTHTIIMVGWPPLVVVSSAVDTGWLDLVIARWRAFPECVWVAHSPSLFFVESRFFSKVRFESPRTSTGPRNMKVDFFEGALNRFPSKAEPSHASNSPTHPRPPPQTLGGVGGGI